MRILVVEDDPTIAILLESILERSNYAIDFATDGQTALDLNGAYEYDAILLDVSLPKLDGISVCRQIRAGGSSVPILLLTALDSPVDRARGLDAGADDYLGKPFDPDELLARVRALLRRSHQTSAPILTWGQLQLDPVGATVTYHDRLIPVTAKEYALLELFLRNSKRVFSCDAILDHLWTYEDAPSAEAIRTHIKGLRHKLKAAGAASDLIETVYGIGYRLKPLNTPTTDALADIWAQFSDRILDRVAELERLAIGFVDGNPPADWQERGRSIAHSLYGSLGTFGFSLSSELARQIERLLSEEGELTIPQGGRSANERGRWLWSTIVALRDELSRPVASLDATVVDTDRPIDLLLISVDEKLTRSLQSLALDRHWDCRSIATLADAKLLLQSERVRCTILADNSDLQPEAIVQLLLDTSKQVPRSPVILLTNLPELDPAIEQLGGIKCTPDLTNIMLAIDMAIDRVESSQTQILIVDDDLKVLTILRALLSPWGFRVTTLAEPQRFWEIFRAAQPDLLILDVEMPQVSGLDLCKAVREQTDRSQLPIVFLTAHTEPSSIRDVFASGADDFVAKPVVGAEIIARIINLLERQHRHRWRSIERQRLTTEAIDLATASKLRTELIEIESALAQENERHAHTIERLSARLSLLHQLFADL